MKEKISQTTFSIIIPAFNEGPNIKSFLIALEDFVLKENILAEFICVDDGSQDNTLSEITNFVQTIARVKSSIIHFDKNQGQGEAFRQGMKKANGLYTLWIPSDGEIPPSELLPLLKASHPDHIVVGYPVEGKHHRPWHRLFLSAAYQKLIAFLFGFKLRYYNAVSIYPASAVVNLTFNSKRFFFPAEILIRLHWQKNYHFIEMPFKLAARTSGRSKALKLSTFLEINKNIIALVWENLRRLFW